MTRRICRCWILVWLFVFARGEYLYGQNPSATVSGFVTDPQGANIPGATVALSNVSTGVTASTRTNGSGLYRIAGLVPGIYRETVTKDGFKSTVKGSIDLHVEDELSINFTLQIGSVSESITVQAGEPALQSESSTVSDVIEGRQVEGTPLNGRNVMNLLALAPGVVPQGATSGAALGNQSAVGNYTNPAGWANYQIAGGTAGLNAQFVDGAPLTLPQENWIGFVPTQDSIREFRVETNNISPEYGAYYGGVVNFTTKSGTNDFHGTAYEYFRNTVLDANDFFNNRNAIKRPPLHQNQYGAFLGGPITRNKAFFFSNWEGYQNRAGIPFSARVPTVAETTGDFTADAPIYYSGTSNQVQCNGVLNKVCPDPTALQMASVVKYWPAPNVPGAPEGAVNFVTNASAGASSNQFLIRTDYNPTERQQVFARYSWWGSNTLATNYFHNNVPQPGVQTTSNQVVVGDTLTLSPSTFADIRLSYLRFHFISKPPFLGHVDLSQFGPAYASLAGQVTYDTLPVPFLVGYSPLPWPLAALDVIQFETFNVYNLSGNITRVLGSHTLRFGGSIKRNEAYFSPNTGGGPTGFFIFVPGYPTTNEFANFMLGYDIPNFSTIQTGTHTGNIQLYQGYYVDDIYHVNQRLTANAGVRWELPGGFLEKGNRNTVFLPGTPSPVGTILNPVTGAAQNLHGNLALVNSSLYASRYDADQHFHLFAPSVGFAYGIGKSGVIRGGYGIAYLPLEGGYYPSSAVSPINTATTPAFGLLSNPFPQINGKLPQPVGRDPNFSANVQGLAVTGRVPNPPYPYVQQWNLSFQQELGSQSSLQIGYLGSTGVHVPIQLNLNQIPDAVAAQAAAQYQSLVASGMSPPDADAQAFVNQQTTNPMAGKLSPASGYSGATISQGQLLRPLPQFANVTSFEAPMGSSSYNSMQIVYKKRFAAAGTFAASYSWAKLLGTVDSTTGYLEAFSVGAIQDNNNLRAERSLVTFDAAHRLVLNYSLTLPLGRGRWLLSNLGPSADRIVSGWTVSGITTFQTGFPLAFAGLANDLSNSFGAGTIRPDRIPGCNPKVSGSPISRLNQWFNIACFAQPSTPLSLGNEPRVDSALRSHGINNWDLSLEKDTQITERVHLTFSAQFLNAFNHVQFGPPVTQFGVPSFGHVTSQLNNPRQIQFASRVVF
jgi:hypothetical protein